VRGPHPNPRIKPGAGSPPSMGSGKLFFVHSITAKFIHQCIIPQPPFCKGGLRGFHATLSNPPKSPFTKGDFTCVFIKLILLFIIRKSPHNHSHGALFLGVPTATAPVSLFFPQTYGFLRQTPALPPTISSGCAGARLRCRKIRSRDAARSCVSMQ
jgi:hypothetical protein